jgi:hypothetical protein
VLGDDGDETLQTAEDRTVDDDRPGGRLVGTKVCVRRPIFQVEAFRKLEIELDRGALERTTQGISDGDIYLRAVEGPITWIKFPLSRMVTFQCLLELLIQVKHIYLSSDAAEP